MEGSETNRIKDNNYFNNQNMGQQQNILIQTSLQNQQGIPFQQNAILYTPIMPQQVYIQNQPYIYPQPQLNQIIVNPIQPNNVVNNQEKSEPKPKETKKESSTLEESTCPYCEKRVKTELKTRCNCCTCLYYISAFFIVIFVCIFTLDISVLNQNCCCCCDQCDCCCDYIRKCPECGEYIYRYDSCNDRCNSLC